MPVTTYTLTGDLSALDGVAFGAKKLRATIRTNIPGGALVDPAGDKLRFGGMELVPPGNTSTFTKALVGTNSTGLPLSGPFQYLVEVEYTDPATRQKQRWESGWFSLTANTNLADVVAEQSVPPTVQSTFLAQVQAAGQAKVDAAAAQATLAQTARAGAEAAKAAADALVLSDLGTTDGQTRALIQNPASQTAAALSASIAATQPSDVACLGDSRFGGNDWPSGLKVPRIPEIVAALVERRLAIVNKGVGGNTTTQMLARFDTDVAPLAPKVVVFIGGTNDFATGIPKATTRANVLAIAQKCRDIGAEFVPCTETPRSQHTPTIGASVVREHNNWLRIVGAAMGWRVIDLHPTVVNPRNGEWRAGYGVDAVHPSAPAVLVLAQTIAQVLVGTTKASLVPASIPYECEVDYSIATAGQSSQLIHNPLFYATISDGKNYPNRADYWTSDTSAAVVTGTSSGATSIVLTENIAPGSYVFSTGQVQQETRTVSGVADNGDGTYTATVSSAFSNPHPAAHAVDRAGTALALVDDNRFLGKAIRITASNPTGPSRESYLLPSTAWSVGDKIRLAGKVALDAPTSIAVGKGAEVAMTFAGPGTTVKAVAELNYATPTGVALTFATDAVVPAGTTGITVTVSFDPGSGSGTAFFGQVGALNLTTLGVADIAFAA